MTLSPPWLAGYQRRNLTADVMAGVIVTVLVIPQSLAYALLAGLPPQAGLYASVVPVLVYAWLGSSMTQAVGPVAITAIMTFAVLSPLAQAGSAAYAALAAVLALLSGVLILTVGMLRLGFLSQLLSRPVVSGFISGSAVLIVISQLKFLLGVPVASASSAATLAALWAQLPNTDPRTLGLSSTALVWLLLSRFGLARLAMAWGARRSQVDFAVRVMPLIVLALATATVTLWSLDVPTGAQRAVAVVGSVSDELAPIRLVLPDMVSLQALATPALILAFIGMVQNITMAQALAVKRRERVDANRELVGLGASNMAAAFFGGMPVGGGLSRSAINTAAGAQTPLASVVAALCMGAVVLMGTQWLSRMPLAVLASSIVVAALGMIDLAALRQAWNYDRADGMALLGTALGVLVLGLQLGIALGVCLSLATLLWRASTPHIAVIGRIAGTEHFRNVQRHDVVTIAGVLFLRIDESLFFGNLSAVEARLAAELIARAPIHDVVLIMSAVNRVDATAMQLLCDTNTDLLERGIRLHLAEVKGPVQDRLMKSPLWEKLSGQVHLSVNEAFELLAKPTDKSQAFVTGKTG